MYHASHACSESGRVTSKTRTTPCWRISGTRAGGSNAEALRSGRHEATSLAEALDVARHEAAEARARSDASVAELRAELARQAQEEDTSALLPHCALDGFHVG